MDLVEHDGDSATHMVKHFAQLFPPEFNQVVCYELHRRAEWRLCLDEHYLEGYDPQQFSDTGSVYYTYSEDHDWNSVNTQDPNRGYFNTLAYTILHTALKSTDITDPRISRVMWNYYSRSSTGITHKDSEQPNTYTLVYNLSDTDGGTYIQDEFYPGRSGDAVLFPSNTAHRGQGPTQQPRRFALNVIFQTS